MRRINRRLVLLLIVLVCDVVSVFGRPQEQHAPSSQLKGNCQKQNETHIMRITADMCGVLRPNCLKQKKKKRSPNFTK